MSVLCVLEWSQDYLASIPGLLDYVTAYSRRNKISREALREDGGERVVFSLLFRSNHQLESFVQRARREFPYFEAL